MVQRLFELAAENPPECPFTFVIDNLGEIAESAVSAYELVDKVGELALAPVCEQTERELVSRIHDARIWGIGVEAMK